MSWLKALAMVGKLIIAVSNAWEWHQKRKQLKLQEQKYDAIKQDAKSSHRQRFGPSSGRVPNSNSKTNKH